MPTVGAVAQLVWLTYGEHAWCSPMTTATAENGSAGVGLGVLAHLGLGDGMLFFSSYELALLAYITKLKKQL